MPTPTDDEFKGENQILAEPSTMNLWYSWHEKHGYWRLVRHYLIIPAVGHRFIVWYGWRRWWSFCMASVSSLCQKGLVGPTSKMNRRLTFKTWVSVHNQSNWSYQSIIEFVQLLAYGPKNMTSWVVDSCNDWTVEPVKRPPEPEEPAGGGVSLDRPRKWSEVSLELCNCRRRIVHP